MSFSYSPGSITAGAFVDVKFASAANVVSATLATITAGKTGYIIAASIECYNNAVVQRQAQLFANGVAFLSTVAPPSASNGESITAPVGYGISLQAGQTITLSGGASTDNTASVWYVEV
jgi:hypothetical protein